MIKEHRNNEYILLNPHMHISPFDNADDDQKILCEVPDTDGKINRITVPESIFNLLKQLNQDCRLDDIKVKYLESDFKAISWEKFECFVQDYCVPNKILISNTEKNFVATPIEHNKLMQFQLPLLKPWLVNPVARILTGLYQPIVMTIMSVIFIALQIFFYLKHEPYVNLSFTGISAEDGMLTILLLILGLFIHEFGHVTAAYKNGCRKMSIGVGWYLYFLVFYAELSESWRLPRKQRVLIDAGGLYFQSIYMAALVIIYVQTTSASIFYCLLFLNFSFIWNLNPFLKMDGYWVTSDLLGISNLRTEAKSELKYLATKLIGRKTQRQTDLNVKSRFYLGIYSILSNVFFVWFSYVLAEIVLSNITTDLPNRLETLKDNFTQGKSFNDATFSLFLFAFQMFVLFFLSRIVIRNVISLTSWIRPAIFKAFSIKVK